MTSDASVIELEKMVVFAESGYAKIDVASSKRLLLGLNTFRPGQSQSVHAHEDQDKFYLVVRGRGVFNLDDQRHPVEEGACVWAPAGVPHGVENESDQPLVVLVGIAPAPGS